MSTVEMSESAIRKRLKRQGLTLCKSRKRWIRENYGDRYLIVDANNNVVGGGSGPDGYSMTLDDCQSWVDGRQEAQHGPTLSQH